MTSSRGVAAVQLQLDAAKTALGAEYVEDGPFQRQIDEVDGVVDIGALVERVELFKIDDRLGGGHAHCHADDQTAPQRLFDGRLLKPGDLLEDRVELAGIGGVEDEQPNAFP